MKVTRGKTITLAVSLVMLVIALGGFLIYREEIGAAVSFWLRFESIGKNAQGLGEYRHRDSGLVFVKVPGGSFVMGSPAEEKGNPNERQHSVTLSPFLIAKYEVTQIEWENVMATNPSLMVNGRLPVTMIGWHEAREFCRKLGFRLPTEAEWEYACRAGTTGPFAGTGRLDDMGWYRTNSRHRSPAQCWGDRGIKSQPFPGIMKPNDFGIHDMHGGVWEWCEDSFKDDFYLTPAASLPDPICRENTGRRIIRGGSWGDSDFWCRSANRSSCVPDERGGALGFRPAVSLGPR